MTLTSGKYTLACILMVCSLLIFSQCDGQGDISGILQYIDKLAKMSYMEQELALMAVGASMMSKTGLDCNIFGGGAACKELPRNSSYLAQCPDSSAKVDCAFYGQVYDNVYDSPVDDLEAYLAKQSWAPAKEDCPECFNKLQKMWCALASPRCGTFRTYTREALLPALRTLVGAYDNGTDKLEALSEVVATSVETIARAMPCREMCEDLMATCGCGSAQEDTFGKLLLSVQQAGLQVPPQFEQVLLARIWDRPFCSLFAPSSTAKFTGTCQLSTSGAGQTCTARERWCAPKTAAAGTGGTGFSGRSGDDVLRYVQGIIALQFARAATGWISDEAMGLWQTRSALGSEDDMEALKAKYVDGRVQAVPDGAGGSGSGRGKVELSMGQIWFLLVLSVGGGVALTVTLTYVYRTVRRLMAERSMLVEMRSAEGFRPLVAQQEGEGVEEDDEEEAKEGARGRP